MYTDQPGWYHAEGDPLDTMRFWTGSEWNEEILGGNTIGQRLGAKIIDALIIGFTALIIGAIFFGTTEITYSILVLHLVLSGIYEIAFLTRKGATPGKILLGFRVVQSSNGKSPPTASSARNRFLPNLVALIPFVGWLFNFAIIGISLYWLTADFNRQSLFDRSGKTFVVRMPRESS